MRASDLTHRVALQRNTASRDSFGEAVPSWSNLVTVWAKIEWGGGGESFQGERDYAGTPIKITVRRSTDTMSLHEGDRVMVPLGYTRLTEMMSVADTTLVVNDPAVFYPTDEATVRISDEFVKLASGSGTAADPYVVSRSQFGTSATIHESDTSAIQIVPLEVLSVTPSRYALEISAVKEEVRTP